MKILIAEDNPDIALIYEKGLDKENYQVIITSNGEDCLRTYHEELHKITFNANPNQSYCSLANNPPFDIVLLDYLMPKINGLDVAKEILSINPHQRIIIASSYNKEIFDEAADNFGLPLEILQKPFLGDELLNMLNDTTLYEKLTKSVIDVEPIKKARLRHEQLKALTDLLDKIDKKRNTG